jgi:hypothetical protein
VLIATDLILYGSDLVYTKLISSPCGGGPPPRVVMSADAVSRDGALCSDLKFERRSLIGQGKGGGWVESPARPWFHRQNHGGVDVVLSDLIPSSGSHLACWDFTGIS